MSYRSLRDHGQARRPQPRHRGNPHRGGQGLALVWTAVGHTAVATQWVYDFAEGSRDMRELLGGKGANVAEMTRVLGAERVPAGFTITTEACVAYMNERRFPEGLNDQIAEGLARLEERAGKQLGDSAVHYRRLNRIPDEWGTAVNVQQMVFGNKGDDSCSGVAFSRDEVTGEPTPSGDFLPNAQGEDVVSGVRTPRDLSELREAMPEVHEDLMEILRTLERHYGDMQDTEFTVEEGSLYMLQTRNAKRPAQAGVRFAVDAVNEGLLDKAAALATIDAEQLDALLHPTFDPDAHYEVLARGVAASPGAAKGEIVFFADDAVAAAGARRHGILVRPVTQADDIPGVHAA